MTCALSKEKETVAKNKSEGGKNGHEQRREPIVTHTVL
jgi:hypothetical protein